MTEEKRVNPEDQRIIATTRKNGEIVINSRAVIGLFVAVIGGLGASGFSLGGKEALREEIMDLRKEITQNAAGAARSVAALEGHFENMIALVEDRIDERCSLKIEKIAEIDAELRRRVTNCETDIRELRGGR